jgi:hypothetical protein
MRWVKFAGPVGSASDVVVPIAILRVVGIKDPTIKEVIQRLANHRTVFLLTLSRLLQEGPITETTCHRLDALLASVPKTIVGDLQ